MLEKLAHYNGILPPDQHFITIDIPASISYEVVTKDSLPGWDDIDGAASRTYGAAWIDKSTQRHPVRSQHSFARGIERCHQSRSFRCSAHSARP
jgi:RES domain-containing protein